MTPRPSTLVALAVALLLGGACGGDEADQPGALEQAIARARPAWTPGQEPARPLAGSGPHLMKVVGEVRIDAPGGQERLTITRTIARGPALAYRIDDERAWTTPSVHEGNAPRTHADRVASLFDGTAFATRRGYGPWLERDVLDGHATRVLQAAYDLQTLVVGGLGDYLAWRDIGPNEERPASIAGLPVTWREASLDPAVRPRSLGAAELAALREHTRDWTAWVAATHRPMRVEGRLAFTAGGEVALGALEIVGVATVEGTEAPFSMKLAVTVERLPADASFALPADRLPVARPRPWKMIEDVLGEDLAPACRPR